MSAPELHELERFVRTAPLADTHEHTVSSATYLAKPADVLRDLFSTYAGHDLVAAGASHEAVDRLVNDHGTPVAERFDAVADAWSRCIHTGYGEAVCAAAREVYGIEEISGPALEAVSARADALHRPGERLRLLKEVAGLEYVQVDDFTPSCPPDREDPEFFFTDLSIGELVAGRLDGDRLSRVAGIEPTDLRTLAHALEALFEREAPTAIAVKSDHAYFRRLRWRTRTDAEVRPLVGPALAGELHDLAAREALGDWCLGLCVRLAIEHRLPVKLHTGYIAGNARLDPSVLPPGQLAELLQRHPDGRFVLMHAGYPHGGELLALAKHFPGVYVDLCWAWSIDPIGVIELLRRSVHAIPSHKLLSFGGDAFWPAESVGYATQAREWLLRALVREVDEDLIDPGAALRLAARWMGGNQAELFDVAGTTEALRDRLANNDPAGPGVTSEALATVAHELSPRPPPG